MAPYLYSEDYLLSAIVVLVLHKKNFKIFSDNFNVLFAKLFKLFINCAIRRSLTFNENVIRTLLYINHVFELEQEPRFTVSLISFLA